MLARPVAAAFLVIANAFAACSDDDDPTETCKAASPRATAQINLDQLVDAKVAVVQFSVPSGYAVEPLPTPKDGGDVVVANARGSIDEPFIEYVLYPPGYVFKNYDNNPVFARETPPKYNTPITLGVGLAGAREHERTLFFLLADPILSDATVEGQPALMVTRSFDQLDRASARRVYIELDDGRLFMLSLAGSVCDDADADQADLFEALVESIVLDAASTRGYPQ